MNKEKDGKRNILLRFFAILGILALLLTLTAGACDEKKAGNGNPPKTPPDPSTSGTKENCAEEGFTVTLANESFKEAFTFSKFAKDADTGSFDADLTVKLSGLTHANGFVSNHVWINPDENKYAMPFEERGILAKITSAAKGAEFVAGDNNFAKYDWKFCGFDTSADDVTKYVVATGNGAVVAGNVWEGFNPTALTGDIDFHTAYNTSTGETEGTVLFDGTNDDSPNKACEDGFRYGDVLQAVATIGDVPITKGKLRVGYALPEAADTTKMFGNNVANTLGAHDTAIKWNEEYETSMDKTGAYYVRDSMAYKYVKEGTEEDAPESGAAAVPFVKDIKHVHLNDTDLLYEEIQRAFAGFGDSMANLASVFDADKNMGISPTFSRQPAAKSADNETSEFGSPWNSSNGSAISALGTAVNGGWQKLFTITPCDTKTMKNGIAVAYGHETKEKADDWKKEPELTFDADGAEANHSLNSADREVVVREGRGDTAQNKNDHALLFESMVSPEYNGGNKLGFFTIQHNNTIVAMKDEKNAFSTKGVIHCRSAVAFANNGTEAENKGLKVIDELISGTKPRTDIAKYANKLQGYKDGEIKDDTTKGPGLTCYLGLSALWPDAIDGAPKLTEDGGAYDVQFEDNKATKKVDYQFDYSDKHLGILMINMPEDVTVNHKLLLPIFNQFASNPNTAEAGPKFKIEKGTDIAKSVLKNIKASRTFGYLHGNVKVTFSKD